MKEYYQQRLYWIFHYSSKKFGYCLAKTLCLIVGVPIYAVCFALEMVLTGVNMIFSWIPILNVVMMVICKSLVTVFGSTFYLCILPDLKEYKAATSTEIEYEVADAEDGENDASTADEVVKDVTAEESSATAADENQKTDEYKK